MKAMSFLKRSVCIFFILVSFQSKGRVVHDEQLWVNINAWFKLNDKWQLYGEYQPRYMDNRKYLSVFFI